MSTTTETRRPVRTWIVTRPGGQQTRLRARSMTVTSDMFMTFDSVPRPPAGTLSLHDDGGYVASFLPSQWEACEPAPAGVVERFLRGFEVALARSTSAALRAGGPWELRQPGKNSPFVLVDTRNGVELGYYTLGTAERDLERMNAEARAAVTR